MLTSSYPMYPGETTAPFIEEIAAGLVRRGHEVHVLLPYHPALRRAPQERGVNLHVYRYSPLPSLNIWGYAQSLRADVGLRGRALLAAPMASAASFASLVRLASRAEPHFDLIHAHWVLPNGMPAALAARVLRLPLVVSLHGSDIFVAERTSALSLTAGAIMRQAGFVSACSSDLCDRALRLGAAAQRIAVVPYGVDPQAFQPDPQAGAAVRAELGLSPEQPLVVSVSRLVYKKGITYLLEAFAQVLHAHPMAILVIAGYGDLREELEQRAQVLGIAASVRFPGQLERERAARYIAAADVYTVPSIRDQKGNVDGLPNALLEGMGTGRPIVASRVAGIPDVIDDGIHGLLVAERDPVAIAGAISRLLADRAFAQRLGDAARARILHELTWDVAAARFEQGYQRALGQEG